jgi:tetratricopeptide (TPR) repeat protein
MFRGKDFEAQAYLTELVSQHAKDDRPYSESRPVPMREACRELLARQRTFMLQRAGRYAEAAEACMELVACEQKNLAYMPESRRAIEELGINVIRRSWSGDLWRFAGDLARAAAEYQKAFDFLKKHQATADAVDKEANVAGGIYGHWKAKLPVVLGWCTGPAGELETRCGLNVDTPIELGEYLLALGRSDWDRVYLQRGYALLRTANSFVISQGIPDSLPPTLKGRYGEVREQFAKELAHEKADMAKARN